MLAMGDTTSLGPRYPTIDYANGGGVNGIINTVNNYLAITNGQTKYVPGRGPLSIRADIERDQHLGIRPVSQLNTWPVVSPVNASRRPSRDAAHHSGLGWLARPFSVIATC
jgi:hypothetical protein